MMWVRCAFPIPGDVIVPSRPVLAALVVWLAQ